MATSSLRSKFEEHLTCSVCLEKLNDPKVLPCLHSFCHGCIVKLARNAQTNNIVCPECRKVVQIDDPNNLSNLPSNFFVNNLLATMALTDGKTTKSIVCDNCDSGDAAESRCEECGIFLCHYCSEFHHRSRPTKHHGLTSIQELKSSAGPASIAEKMRCAKHKEEIIKLYCNTCQATICRDCTIVDHQGHKYGFIEDVALQEKQKLQTNVDEVKQRKVRVQQGIASLKKFDENLVAKQTSLLEKIDQHFAELTKVMDTKKMELVQKASSIIGFKQKQIHAQLEQLEVTLASCESSIEFTEKAFKNGNDAQVLSMQKYILNSLEDLKKIKDQIQPCVTEDMEFSIPQSVKDTKEKLFNSYDVDDVEVSPGNCIASFHTELKIRERCRSSITIICYDKNNKRLKHGGQLIQPTISGVIVDGDVVVNDNNDGSHTVTFCSREGGVMKFEVTINGHPSPRCSLTENLKWAISNAHGYGEISDDGLAMTGGGWRIGDCSFESGVHIWKVQVSNNPVYNRRDHNRRVHNRRGHNRRVHTSGVEFEVGVTDPNAIDEKLWVRNIDCQPNETFDICLTLNMENRSLIISEGNRSRTRAETEDEIANITALRVSPYFSISCTNITLSIIEWQYFVPGEIHDSFVDSYNCIAK